MRYIVCVLLYIVVQGHIALAQPDFCHCLDSIIADGNHKFMNVRDTFTGANPNGASWGCRVKVPGIMKSRFVNSMGLRYEGAVFQTRNEDKLGEQYSKYKAILDNCLLAKGYQFNKGPNFYPGLEDFKKLMYTKIPGKDSDPNSAPPHVSLEVDYNKQMAVYTILLYVWEH